MLTLFLLLIIDYLFTYIGLRLNFITEANPLMKHIFNYNIQTGLVLRCSYSLGIVILLFLIKRKKPAYYKKIIIGAAILYTFVIILHIRWIALIQ